MGYPYPNFCLCAFLGSYLQLCCQLRPPGGSLAACADLQYTTWGFGVSGLGFGALGFRV